MSRAKINEESRALYLARALYDAVEDCNIKQVDTLLSQNKANPNVLIPEERMTPFHLAAGHENLAFGKVAASLILHNGGDPNVRCDGNRTVLHIAVAWNRSLVVEILLKSPYIIPNPYIKDDDNLNVFNYAMKFNAWESLATLQSYMKHPNYINKQNNQVCRATQLKYIEEENSVFTKDQKSEKSIAESTFNKSDRLHTSSGYLNSGESLDSTSRSIKHDLVSQKNNLPSETILSLTSNSLSDVLNKNISLACHAELIDDIPSSVHSDGSIMSSITSLNNDFDDIENISFPSQNFLADSELFKFNDFELTTENIFSQPKMCSNNNEWMTDISGLSSYLGSDDYFTCPDSNSEKHILNTGKADIQLEDIKSNLSMTSFYGSIRRSLSKISQESNLHINSSDESSSSLTEIIDDYDTDFVRQSLRKYGYPPGPLVPSTKRLYVRKLNKIIQSQAELDDHDDKHINILPGRSYSSQLTKVLMADVYDTWKKTIKSWCTLENDIVSQKSGSSFTYLLLDPRITNNLPARADQINNPLEIWQTFISSIFYIGKGTKSRPNNHMNAAFNSWIEKNNKEISRKTEHILSIWKEKMGVVCVQAFHHLELKEAHIREASMIDAIGLENLTNEKRGSYYDNTVRWRNSDRCKLGCHLLYRAMLVFLADGERQLQPVDLT